MEKFAGEAGSGMIRKVPVARSDSLLHRCWIPARTKELLIVVGLEDQEVTVFESEPDLSVGPSQIRCDPHASPGAAVHQCHGHRIRCVVHGQEGLDTNRSNVEHSARLIRPQGLGVAENTGACGARPIRDVYGSAVTTAEDPGSVCVVTMIVRDHNGMDRFRGQSDLSKPSRYLPAAEPGIDQDSRPARLYERSVAGAASPENADLQEKAVDGVQ